MKITGNWSSSLKAEWGFALSVTLSDSQLSYIVAYMYVYKDILFANGATEYDGYTYVFTVMVSRYVIVKVPGLKD